MLKCSLKSWGYCLFNWRSLHLYNALLRHVPVLVIKLQWNPVNTETKGTCHKCPYCPIVHIKQAVRKNVTEGRSFCKETLPYFLSVTLTSSSQRNLMIIYHKNYLSSTLCGACLLKHNNGICDLTLYQRF